MMTTIEDKTGQARGEELIVAEKLAKTEVAIKVLDHHIEILEAMLLFLLRSQDPSDDLLHQHEKKIATVKQEIEFAVRERQNLKKVKEMDIESMDDNYLRDIQQPKPQSRSNQFMNAKTFRLW